ncbi:MAG: AAA family ATPase [archaeon]
MTRLIKLTLKNFKSFKKAEIPISKGFTSIVGSNGSGKSNVLDGLLFVLGITSLKTLRASRLSDLVNDGSKESYAKVDLIVKHADKQYEISRMIDKQGKSVYRLDGKRTTLNEISSLLTELGIDVTGHNIVAQGDITRVIEMSSIERREIIDDLAGLSEFDEKKEEALKELDKVDSKIKEATIILNERNAFLVELEEEMNAAKEFTNLETEKKRIKATIIGREISSIDKRLLEVDTELRGLEKQRTEIEENIVKAREELSKAKSESSEMGKIMLKTSEELYITIGREFEEKKGQLRLEQEKIELKKELIQKNNQKLDENQKEAESAKKEAKENEIKRKQHEQERKETEREFNAVQKKKEALEKVVKGKNEELRKLEAEIDSLNKEIDEGRKEIFDLEVFFKQWDRQKAYNEKKLSELAQEETSLLGEIAKIEEKKKKLGEHGDAGKIEKDIATLEKTLEEMVEDQTRTSAQKEAEEKAINDLKKALSKCPVCDSMLEEKKKKELIETKKKLIEEHEKNEKRLTKEIVEQKQKTTETRDKLMMITKLLAEIGHEKSVQTRLTDARTKITVMKKELEQKSFDEQLGKRNRLNEKIKISLTKRDASKERLAALRGQNIFEEFSVANREYEDLFNKKSLIEAILKELESNTKILSEKAESLLVENSGLESEVAALKKEIRDKEDLVKDLGKDVSTKEDELEKAKKKNSIMGDEKEKLDKKIERMDKDIIADSIKSRKLEMRQNEFSIEKSRIEVRVNDLKEEGKAYLGSETISEKTVEGLLERLDTVERRLGEIGAVNLKALGNFTNLKGEVSEIQEKATKLAEERLAVLDMIDKIEFKRTNVFMDCFSVINKNFQDMFLKFFNGEGNLTLSEAEKPLESGLIIDARQKAGKLQNIDSMSGGEKTLTALAFMFAIQLYKPAPFYAFDEADAALDKENSMKMGNLIEMIAEKSQFIAITHNDTITKKADQIIGVARAKDGSSVIGLRLKTNEEEMSAQNQSQDAN